MSLVDTAFGTVLCADEPTSGLDSFTAVTVIEALKNLTLSPTHRTTIICTIHQPRADIFQMFDYVLLLSKGGYSIYCGPTMGLNPYFESLHFACPLHSNPADYYMDISSIDPIQDSIDNQSILESPSKARVKHLVRSFQNYNSNFTSDNIATPTHQQQTNTDQPPIQISAKYATGWTRQVSTLTQRCYMNTYRDPWNLIGGIGQSMLLSAVITAIFWQLPDSLTATESRCGLLYITTTLEPYIFLLILVERYGSELKIFDRELQDDMYSPSAYFVSQFIASLPQFTVQPILYSIPVYFGCNLRSGGQYFFTFLCVNIVITFIVSGLAWCCVSLHRSFSVSSLIANTNYTFICLTAGYLVNFNSLPIYIFWVKFISFLAYSYQIVMVNEFSDNTLGGCPYDDDPDCTQYDGNEVLQSNGIANDNYISTWPPLLTIFIVYHLVAVLLLDFIRNPVTGSIILQLNFIHHYIFFNRGCRW